MPENALDRKAQAVTRLARGESTDAVGAALGINGRTVRRWREKPGFETDIRTARRAVLNEAVAALGAAVRDAVTALHAALDNESVAIRVRAASVLLSALPAISAHVELAERVARIEALLQGEEQL